MKLPYFDLLLEGRRSGAQAAKAFNSFVHWGFWADPSRAPLDGSDFPAAMDRLNDQVLAAADIADGQAVLDAGCGFGGTLASINARRRDMRLTGLNIDPRQLEVAQAAVAPHDGNTVRFVPGDACALPFEAGSFDRVLAVECIFHFPSRRTFLGEAARVLKPGGLLALSDFVPLSPGGAASWLGRKLEAKVSEGYGTLGSGWPDGDYAAMARSAGLVPVLDQDITRQTLPTYPILKGFIRAGEMGGPEGRLLGATRLLEWLSWLGVLRYKVAAFRKPS